MPYKKRQELIFLVQKEVASYIKFEEIFKKTYWNLKVQDSLRRTLTGGAC